jgi:uncharacterized protein YfaS (alpha-2-macroglobulin family)
MLDVSTSQILDLILPEFRRGSLDAAAGGDRDGAIGRHLNPFRRKGEKPAVYWSGVLDADSTPRELEYVVPDYFNGTLRVIAVAVADDSVGVREASTLVRGDFVLSPNAPTTVTPGDEFEVSVGIANDLDGSGPNAHLRVELKPEAAIELQGPAVRDLVIAENREDVAHFRLRALDRPGSAGLEFSVTSAGSSARRRIDISVRPATPYMTTLAAGTLKQESREVKVERDLYPEYRTLEASVSLLPLSLAHGLSVYLTNYPYLCTEQIVSRTMPALMLAERPEFGSVRAEPGADLKVLIEELELRQNDQGAFKLWPGGNQVVEFVSLYAQQFLIEAAARGKPVPAGMIENGNAYLKTVAARDGNNLAEERDSAYAVYLLTRQGILATAEAQSLNKRLTERYKGQWEEDLAAAWLSASLELMHQDNDARRLISRMRFGVTQPDGWLDDAMTRDAFLLYLLAKHFPDRLADLAPQALATLATRINDNAYDSLSAGASLLALDAYVGATHADLAPRLAISEVRGDKSVHALELPPGLMPNASFTEAARAVKFTSGAPFDAYYLVSMSGFERTPPKAAIARSFEILREYTDPTGHPVTQIRMGDEVQVHLKFRALEDRGRTQVALVDLLPGGFDLVVPQTGASSGCAFCLAAPTLLYADPREDRVVFYAMPGSDIQEIVYRVKATNLGRYTVPPAYGEAMYDRGVAARSAAGRIEVISP